MSEQVDTSQPSVKAQAREPWRFAFLAGAFALAALLVLFRLLSYTLFPAAQGAAYQAAPDGAHLRGSVVDRDGNVLSLDRYFAEVTATPLYLSAEDRAEVAAELQQLAGLDAARIEGILAQAAEQRYALLGKGLSQAAGERILERQSELESQGVFGPMQYVHVRIVPRRYYPQGELAAHVVGFVGVGMGDQTQRQGYYGVEGYYNSFLWGDGVGLTGSSTVGLGALSPDVRRYLPSLAGKDLVLTIDRTIQWIVEDELARAVEKYGAEGGTVIVMEPHSGAVLGLANWPAYDPNSYGESDPERYANPAISAQYEPGSIYKIVTIAAGLDTGVISPTTYLTDTGSFSLGQRIFFNSNRAAYGRVTITEALARSLNVITAQVAEMVGKDDFYRYVQRFGFGSPTEIDLAGEVNGAVKMPHNENWSLSDLGTNSFGQGLAVTPIQMVNAAASIANGGKLMRPYTVQARIHQGQVLLAQPTVLRTAISPETAEELTGMLIESVEFGTPLAAVKGYSIAGKTGTAQIPTAGGYLEDETIVSFVGYAPADDPRFVVLIKLDRPDPKISAWATYTAAPAFAEIATRLFAHMSIPPDDIRLGRQTEQLVQTE